MEGAVVEEKGLTASVHYRQVPSGDEARVRQAVRETVEEHVGGTWSGEAVAGEGDHGGPLQLEEGKQVLELRPAVNWNEGRAVEWLREVLVPDGGSWHPVYVDDDVTDEDAFRALSGTGTTVRVGDGPTEADYYVDGPGEVASPLTWLAAARGQDRSDGSSTE